MILLILPSQTVLLSPKHLASDSQNKRTHITSTVQFTKHGNVCCPIASPRPPWYQVGLMSLMITDEEAAAQRGDVSCPRSHNQSVGEVQLTEIELGVPTIQCWQLPQRQPTPPQVPAPVPAPSSQKETRVSTLNPFSSIPPSHSLQSSTPSRLSLPLGSVPRPSLHSAFTPMPAAGLQSSLTVSVTPLPQLPAVWPSMGQEWAWLTVPEHSLCPRHCAQCFTGSFQFQSNLTATRHPTDEETEVPRLADLPRSPRSVLLKL